MFCRPVRRFIQDPVVDGTVDFKKGVQFSLEMRIALAVFLLRRVLAQFFAYDDFVVDQVELGLGVVLERTARE